NKSYFHKRILQQVLKTSELILSTSETMKSEGLKYTFKDIFVTPFGVDLKLFNPEHLQKKTVDKEKTFQLGVVKALEKKYGIEILIRAYAKVIPNLSVKSKLTIVGGGSQMETLRKLIDELDLQDLVELKGA